MKKFFYILSSLAVAVFVLVAILLVIGSVDIPGVPLDARTVLTSSMEPTIPTGSVVFIYPRDSYEEGDIVTFKRMESSLETPITHRIVRTGVDEQGVTVFTTKGDGNAYEDTSLLYADEIWGKVLFHFPFVGKLLVAAKTPWGFAALIVIPAVLVIFDEAKKIAGYVRGRRREVKEDHNEPPTIN